MQTFFINPDTTRDYLDSLIDAIIILFTFSLMTENIVEFIRK